MKNLFDQEPYALRGENDARIAGIGTDLTALDARLDILAADSGWLDVSALGYVNSWVDHSAGYKPSYRKIGNLVKFRGLIKNGTVGAHAFIMPVGFRPAAAEEIFTVSSNSAFGDVRVRGTDGALLPFVGNNAFFSLSNVTYYVD